MFSFLSNISNSALGSLLWWMQLPALNLCLCRLFLFFSYNISSPISLLCLFAAFPLLHCFHALFLMLCLSFNFLLLSHSLASLLFLVCFEVLNNTRASLPSKLIGKSKLKLQGTVQHSRSSIQDHRGVGRGWAASQVQSECVDNDTGCTDH